MGNTFTPWCHSCLIYLPCSTKGQLFIKKFLIPNSLQCSKVLKLGKHGISHLIFERITFKFVHFYSYMFCFALLCFSLAFCACYNVNFLLNLIRVLYINLNFIVVTFQTVVDIPTFIRECERISRALSLQNVTTRINDSDACDNKT